MLKVKGLSKSYGPHAALANVSFNLGEGQKAALVGPNGVGKSTLLRIIFGEESPDSGTVGVLPRTRIGYFPQEITITGEETIEQYLKRIVGILEIERRIRDLESDLSDPKKIEEYGELQEKYRWMDGYNFDNRIAVFLAGFGLSDVGTQTSLNKLSGGQKAKIALTGLLLGEPDLLLLDEPTNNLDLPALIWLEEFLRRVRSAALIVSHDRRFLDAIVSKVFEIDWETHGLKEFPGTYSAYLLFKEKELRRLKEQYEREQEDICLLKETAREKRQWAQQGARQVTSDKDKFSRGVQRDRAAKSAVRARAIETRIEQMGTIEKPKERPPLSIPLDVKERGTGQIELEGVVVRYPGSNFRLGPVDLAIPYGARIAILGINGSGKSTLLNTIGGTISPAEGEVRIGPSLVIGSLMQFHENLPLEETVVNFLIRESKIDRQECYRLLARFGLEPTKVNQSIQTLSPGERARTIIALFSARGVNVLLLDEPTNHLDIEAADALEEVLSGYEGTVVAVSHDRHFLERVRPQVLYLVQEGKLKQLPDLSSYIKGIQRDIQQTLRFLT